MLPDAVYRRRPDGGWVCTEDEELFGPPPPDPSLDDAVACLIGETLEETGSRLLLGPAGIGSHVDHVITSRAVGRASMERRVPLWQWRDEPYASWSGAAPARADCVVIPYSRSSLAVKLDALRCYRSQVSMLWPAGADWRTMVSTTGLCGEQGEVFEPQHTIS